jgi:hypothetical protein
MPPSYFVYTPSSIPAAADFRATISRTPLHDDCFHYRSLIFISLSSFLRFPDAIAAIFISFRRHAAAAAAMPMPC